MRVEVRIRQVERCPETVRVGGQPFPEVETLVFAQPGRLGDLIVALPALQALRETYSGARVALIVAEPFVPLARCVPGVETIADGSVFALRGRLRPLTPQLAVCVRRSARLAWAVRASGIPHRVGPGRRYYASLYNRRVPESRRGRALHEVEFALSFAHRAGAAGGQAVFPLRVPEEARKRAATWIERMVPQHPLVVLHPGGGGSCPCWPPTHYHQLARLLSSSGFGVVVSLGPQDAGLRDVGPAPARPFVGDLQTLAALLQHAQLLISNSTGPLHLAAALGTPTLALHAPWPSCSIERWGPYSDRGWAVEAYHAGSLTWSRGKRNRLAPVLMAEVQPQRVHAAAVAILEDRSPVA